MMPNLFSLIRVMVKLRLLRFVDFGSSVAERLKYKSPLPVVRLSEHGLMLFTLWRNLPMTLTLRPKLFFKVLGLLMPSEAYF